ncbi:MAG: hypothetical protein BWY46_02027 [Firmicutes bacterium ADurb.Bin300]|jgi:hypothetical protein|nr:MAG: hypothetical protein BWY46_02027 [Firmicutes bacterium ADurb.Bin300]
MEIVKMAVQTMNTYKTSDLYLSAFLKARGMRLRDKFRNGNKFVFIFDDRDDRKELIQEFFNDGSVSITAFKNAIQDLKTMVFNT